MLIITIITPVYNVQQYLPRCLDSILAQTYTDFELLLINDGSTDNSSAICDEYAARDSRIKVIHQKNQGQAAARNHALDIAAGEYIAFVDSDDYIHPGMLEILLRNALENHAQISICGHTKVSDSIEIPYVPDVEARVWNGSEYVRKCFSGEVPHKAWLLWDKLFHRDCFVNARLPEGRIYEDNATVYKLLYEAAVIAECDTPLYYYYCNENSTVNRKFSRKHLDWLLVPEEMILYFSDKKDLPMIDKCNRMYLSALEDMYQSVKKHLDDRQLTAELKEKLKTQYHHEKKRYPISIRTHPGLYGILYPVYSQIYWTAKGVLGKFRKG